MAQPKRKRRTKHRGNAAGVVEARGRTTRPPSAEEKKRKSKQEARNARLLKPPTWKGSVMRAALAAAFMFVFLALTAHPKHGSRFTPALLFAVIAFVVYLPAGYYLESYLYRRRLAKQEMALRR